HRLHSLLGERSGILNRLFTDLAELLVDSRVVLVGSLALQYAARPEFLSEVRVLGIVRIVGLFFGIEMVEVSEELIESVHSGQMLVAVAEVVLAELPGGITEIFHELSNRGIVEAETKRCARHANLGEAGSNRRLSGDKRGSPRGATLLTVEV